MLVGYEASWESQIASGLEARVQNVGVMGGVTFNTAVQVLRIHRMMCKALRQVKIAGFDEVRSKLKYLATDTRLGQARRCLLGDLLND